MKAHFQIAMVDTNIIPDRNAGVGSLLWDLQNPQDPDRDGPSLLSRRFAFIDVGVSRARAANALQSLLSQDLKMDVDHVATERPEAIPFAYVTPVGNRAARIRASLNRMISSKGGAREVVDWHFTVDGSGKVASIAYRYDLHGNEIWEAYFMGRPFLYAGEIIEFSRPELDAVMTPVVAEIEEGMHLARIQARPASFGEGFRVEWNPLESSLAASGIALQATEVPQRIPGKQNVLFLGNVLNQVPRHEQARQLARISSQMAPGDLVIVQSDEAPTAGIDVLRVTERNGQMAILHMRRIDTATLEVHQPDIGPDRWKTTSIKAAVIRAADQAWQSLCARDGFTTPLEESRQRRVQRQCHHVFATFHRALPTPETIDIATREVLRRLSPGTSLPGTSSCLPGGKRKAIPV